MKGFDRLSDPRILVYADPVIIPADILDLVGKVYNLCRVKTIRIAVSTVMDGRLDLRDSLKCFVFKLKSVFEKSFRKVTLMVSVLKEQGEGTVSGTPKVFCHMATEKGGSVCRLATRSKAIWLLYLVLSILILSFLNKFIEMS